MQNRPEESIRLGTPAVKKDRRPSVLLADDDPELTALLKSVLSGDMDCRIARNGSVALQLIRHDPPDLVLLDVNMPVMNGFEVLRTIRADSKLRHLRVVLLTADGEPTHIQVAGALGANDYVIKPFRVSTILQRIRHVLNE